VDAIWVLIVPRGRSRLAAVQLIFRRDSGHAGKARNYLVIHVPPKSNGRAHTAGWCEVWDFADRLGRNDLDLRVKGHVALLEEVLAGLEVEDAGNA
jgi:hypothetical protein